MSKRMQQTKLAQLDVEDQAIVKSTLAILNNILLRNNLDMRAAVISDDGVVLDSKEIYENLAKGLMFVRTREGGKA